ncbi:MAG: DUF1175 domain-containing protein [candidate division KSB1 bacterium]|nr:DUF1175 domain-containing protein [candidate division KSB1 bacterium]MDZ7300725.1 DUF1175 domain-containing protein [candidate division KSB1 bacterium]MDZ7310005.1 DUF1175 domain-containing protein [candidate division KSB1 bacterium]
MNRIYFVFAHLFVFGIWLLQSCSTQPEQTSQVAVETNVVTANNTHSFSKSDLDADGFPDACELDDEADRRNFRRWFVAIAESQLYKEDPAWRKDDHDCAGFIRFAYREALKQHDTNWLRSKPYLIDAAIPDVRKYNYPAVPLLQTKIFRTRDGRFTEADLSDTTFAITALASKLRSYNTIFLGKSLENVQPGDLLFYLNTGDVNMPQHSMIFVGDPRRPPSFDDYVIYHTGPRDGNAGVLKKVRLADLLKHPDERWHPAPENRYFLGYYRWKILE